MKKDKPLMSPYATNKILEAVTEIKAKTTTQTSLLTTAALGKLPLIALFAKLPLATLGLELDS